jgi:hypothetical protein
MKIKTSLLVYVKSGPPKSPSMEVGCELQVLSGGRRGIYSTNVTGGWLEEQSVETYFYWRFSLHNRQWKWSIYTKH